MLIFLFTTLLTFFKLIVYSTFTQEQLLIKIIISICLIIIIGVYLKHKAPVLDTALKIISKYKLKSKPLSFIILITYAGLFILFILLLRIANQNKSVNLADLYYKIHSIIFSTPFFVFIINCILCALVFIVYIIFIITIFKCVKKHIIILHIYYGNYKTNKTYVNKWNTFYYKYSHHALYLKLSDKLDKVFFGFSISYHIIAIIRILHYLTLIIALLYDLIYNHYTIHVVFYILPYIFIYQIFIKISDFYCNLNELHDAALHEIIYAKSILTAKDSPFIKDDELLVDSEHYEVAYFRDLLFIYLQYGLNHWLYNSVVEKVVNYRFNYMLDWNLRIKK